MSHVQEDHDEAFLPFVGIIIAELTSATVVNWSAPVVSRLSPRCHPSCSQMPPVSVCYGISVPTVPEHTTEKMSPSPGSLHDR